MDKPSKQNSENAYSIGAVARLTGISAHALRIWERRYGTVIADRTATGRRIYSRRDVEKLSLLKLLVDQGFSIGQIAGLSLEKLRRQHGEVAAQISNMREISPGQELRVAVLAGFAVCKLKDCQLPKAIKLVIFESDYSRFRADVKRDTPDALLLEFPVIDKESLRRIADLRSMSTGIRIVVLFNFAHPQEISELAAAKVELVRSPIDLKALVRNLIAGGKMTQPLSKSTSAEQSTDPALRLLEEHIPPRRFAESELATLKRLQSNIECECPTHLTEIIQSLSTFEVYSEQCESRDSENAALHRYLHGASARARAIMEEALQTLVVEDNIDLDSL